MAMPEHATTVHYSIHLYDPADGGNEVRVALDVGLTRVFPETVSAVADAAVQAGADAIMAHLQALYPNGQITASRAYDLADPGDPWPAGAQPLAGE